MKVKELLPIVQRVKSYLAQRDVVESLKFMYIEKGAISAFSGNAGIRWMLPADVPTCVVPGAEFVQHLSIFAERGYEDVEFTLTNADLFLKSGKLKLAVALLAKDVPVPSELIGRPMPKGLTTVDLTPEFWADVAKVEASVSKNETQQRFRGVCWFTNGAFISTDNARMTLAYPLKDKGVRCPSESVNGVLIPDYLLQLLGAGRAELTKAGIDENVLWLSSAGGVVSSQRIVEEFPAKGALGAIRDLRIASGKSGLTVTCLPLTEVVNTMLSVAPGPEFAVTVTVTKKDVTFTVPKKENSRASAEEVVEIVSMSGPGKPGTFKVNGAFLKDAVAVTPTFWFDAEAEKPKLYFHNPETRVEHMLSTLT